MTVWKLHHFRSSARRIVAETLGWAPTRDASTCLHSSSGYALVETALMMPFLLALTFNAVNFGYFLVVAVNLAAAPRSGVEYSILGSNTPSSLSLPSAGPSTTNSTVSYVTYQDMTGAIYQPSTKASVQVCSQSVGLNNAGTSTQTTKCSQFPSGTFPSPHSDPESPNFVLNRVDVHYTFAPLIDGRLFNLVAAAALGCSSTCTFQRSAEMRAIN